MALASEHRHSERTKARFKRARQNGPSSRYDLPTFCDHGPDHRTTKWHRYTACFLPELAARLIRRHSRPGETVLDSFLGSGTTAIQAIANGRHALGIDVHPAAIEIARARLAPVFPKALDNAVAQIKRLLKRTRTSRVDLPADPNGWEWERWFPPSSHAQLSQLRRLIMDVRQNDVRRLLLVSTAGALKPVSFWYSHATKLQFDPTKSPQDVQEVMKQRLDETQKINNDLWEHVKGRKGFYQRRNVARLEVGDCCALPFDAEAADLAVSSPPYFVAYDYAKLLRMTSWWILGWVPDGSGHVEAAGRGNGVANAKAAGLGTIFAETFRCASQKLDAKQTSYSQSHLRTLVRNLPPFFDCIRRALSEFFRALRPAGKLCLVLGNTRHCGVTIPTAEIATELALMHGFKMIAVHIRRQHSATQPQGRDVFGQFTSNDAPNQYSYRDENVVVLRKP